MVESVFQKTSPGVYFGTHQTTATFASFPISPTAPCSEFNKLVSNPGRVEYFSFPGISKNKVHWSYFLHSAITSEGLSLSLATSHERQSFIVHFASVNPVPPVP